LFQASVKYQTISESMLSDCGITLMSGDENHQKRSEEPTIWKKKTDKKLKRKEKRCQDGKWANTQKNNNELSCTVQIKWHYLPLANNTL